MKSFGGLNSINIKNIKMNNVGRYSITRPYEAQQIVNNIKRNCVVPTDGLVITDATCGVGGDTLHFSKNFKKVNSVDILEENCSLLKINCEHYLCNNVTIINRDYTNIWMYLQQDIIYFDPPWGGVEYKKQKKIKLYLSDMYLPDLIGEIFAKNRDTKIFLKAPINLYMEDYSIFNINIYKIYNKNKIYSFNLLFVEPKS